MEGSEPRNISVLLAGATGYIGRAVAKELVARGYSVTGIVRERTPHQRPDFDAVEEALCGVERRQIDLMNPDEMTHALSSSRFDAVISCVASRNGVGADAWAVDYQANRNLLAAAERCGVQHFVLLSAICVQRPRLAFQEAKLAFERELIASGLGYSIVRPTAFFKSISGQINRVREGKPFLLFGDGGGTACKPIGERDLARFIVSCLDDTTLQNRILPIGGPGDAITPRQQGELLFELAGMAPRFRRVPVAIFDAALALLVPLAKALPRFEAKADLARIGRYYATESMLLWDEGKGEYDADATPSYGEETLRAHYARVLREGLSGQSLGEHRLF